MLSTKKWTCPGSKTDYKVVVTINGGDQKWV